MPSSLNTSHAQSAEVEITSEFILTVLATALGVGLVDVGQAIPLLKQGTTYDKVAKKIYITPSTYLAIQPLISHPQSSTGLNEVLSQCQMYYESDADGPPISNNLSSPTMTKQETSSAYKPATLTLTGQLKPNTLTKATPKKSSRSSKKKENPFTTAMNPSFWPTTIVGSF